MKIAILSILKSIELYLALKNKMFFYDFVSKSKQQQIETINEIEKLRDKGDSNSSDHADLLLQQLKSERKDFEYLSALYSKTVPQGSDSNS